MSTCCHHNAVRRAKIERRKRDNIVTQSKAQRHKHHVYVCPLLVRLKWTSVTTTHNVMNTLFMTSVTKTDTIITTRNDSNSNNPTIPRTACTPLPLQLKLHVDPHAPYDLSSSFHTFGLCHYYSSASSLCLLFLLLVFAMMILILVPPPFRIPLTRC